MFSMLLMYKPSADTKGIGAVPEARECSEYIPPFLDFGTSPQLGSKAQIGANSTQN
jgi:hypothetical protein